jgi:sugar-specific transcriptional regulator TrmB
MLVKQELIGKIKDYFELNIYETKVWLALLGKGAASAGEIATISGVPRSRTYDVLESLEKKGFCIIKLGKPVKYLGVKPKVILEKLKNNVRVEAEDKVKSLGGLKDTEEFKQLEELYNVGINPVKREDLSASIKGRNSITSHLREIIESATEEVIFCASVNELSLREKIYNEMFNELKDRGVKIKAAVSGNKELFDKLKQNLDIPIKHIEIKSKFFIVDRKEVLFYLSPESTKDDQAIWINSEFFSEGFAGLFDIVVKD